ncbi:MAG: bifunctional folylpolyglutamate synthase/dihydrofolate synthase [Clostridiales bacterium]|nr:bifunctional folylpolyglutamate synthase/dihydrofolate synthase [Clostridiales bacterium]
MNYKDAMAFLEGTKKYGSRLGLDSIRTLMSELGDVQTRLPVVHIGGTNGKGSVGAYLSSVLTEAGYRVGWFNTPDVFSYEEEFRICGVPIGQERLAEIFTEVKAACARMMARGFFHPTRFEVETAAAFLWFCEEGCDIAIMEVGMGGETDATNIIERPLVSVLTHIGMDHMRFLGNTPAEIAAVKAGIIKPGCPVVTVSQDADVMSVIEERCRECGAPLFISENVGSENSNIKNGEIGNSGNKNKENNWDGIADVSSKDFSNIVIKTNLHGIFQQENLSCALKVLEILQPQYPAITAETVADGIANTRWPGRYEKIASHPDIYLDGAHNEPAARRLSESLDADFQGRKIHYIMGVLADKDYATMADIMFTSGDTVYTVTPPNPRGLPAEELANCLREKNITAVPCLTIKDAVSCVLGDATVDDVILAFGSLSYLKEAREICYRWEKDFKTGKEN